MCVRAVAVAVAVVAAVAAGPGGARSDASALPAAQSAAAQLEATQRELNYLSVVTGTFTASWMGQRPAVGPLRARAWALERELREELADSGTRRTRVDVLRGELRLVRRELAPMWPSWLASKAVLHASHRSIERLLASIEPTVRDLLGSTDGHALDRGELDRWFAAWPMEVRPGSPIAICPLAGPFSLVDSFGAPRPGGRHHEGQDLLTARWVPVVAVADGEVVDRGNALGGNALGLYPDAGGYMYYAHLEAYAGLGRVGAGDVIGYAGNSGNARGLVPHLHFEYHPPGQGSVDTYRDLRAVC